jgi:hypothetical protein
MGQLTVLREGGHVDEVAMIGMARTVSIQEMFRRRGG